MKKNISIFIPLRSGSQRIKGKNHIKFNNKGESLFEYKLNQIAKISNLVLEVIISTDDLFIIEQAKNFVDQINNIQIVKRPKDLCLSTTKVSDLIAHAEKITKGKDIFWIHVTSPFVDNEDYSAAIDLYNECRKNKKGDWL